MQTLALKICHRFEALEHWPQSPPEAILSAHASVSTFPSMFFQKKERKKLTPKCTRLVLPPSTYPRMRNILCGAVVSWQKSKGWGKIVLTTRLPTNDPFYRYIYPPTFRSKMAELWGLPELRHWWLPNDEGYPPIVRSIRAFIEDRTQPRAQAQSEELRNIRAI